MFYIPDPNLPTCGCAIQGWACNCGSSIYMLPLTANQQARIKAASRQCNQPKG
jgi:hypothetical protein